MPLPGPAKANKQSGKKLWDSEQEAELLELPDGQTELEASCQLQNDFP